MKGKCLCGQVEFEISGNLPNLYQCHCNLCKKTTGTSSCSSLVIDSDKIKWIKGKDKISTYTKENGFITNFCSTCGSPVPNKMNIGEYIWVPAGSLEGPINRKVAVHIFTESKASWEQETSNCKNIESGPDNINEFMQSLQNEQ